MRKRLGKQESLVEKGAPIGTLYIRNLPLNVTALFKSYCIKRGKTMTQMIKELVALCVSCGDDDDLREVIDGQRLVKDSIPNSGCDDSDEMYEIIDGVRTVKTMGLLASIIVSRLGQRLGVYAKDHEIGLVVFKSIYKFPDAASRRPDISLVTFDQLNAISDLGSDPAEPELAPKLTVEVVSAISTFTAVEKKIIDYFACGVEAVWVILPETKRMHIYDSPKDCKILDVGDTLEGGKVLPGFAMPVADVFAIPRKP